MHVFIENTIHPAGYDDVVTITAVEVDTAYSGSRDVAMLALEGEVVSETIDRELRESGRYVKLAHRTRFWAMDRAMAEAIAKAVRLELLNRMDPAELAKVEDPEPPVSADD